MIGWFTSSLFSKIMIWFFLNLLLLVFLLLFVFNLDFRFRPQSSLLSIWTNRLERLSPQITNETQDKTREERDAILQKYSAEYKNEFFIFDDKGRQIAGREITLPKEVSKEMTAIGSGDPMLPTRNQTPGNPPVPSIQRRPPFFFTRTTTPPHYWSGAPIFLFNPDSREPVRARLIAASDSFSGHGLFFDPTPWLIIAGAIFLISTLFWLPFVRNITKTIGQMTSAAEQIAEEKFSVRVNEKRSDEIGRLGKAINYLAERLSGFVHGQKRFLGDISHELNSPLARMQFALSILENRVDKDNQAYVEDVKEEVELMSKLVSELLMYSKSGLKGVEAKLESVNLHPLIKNAVERETFAEEAEIEIKVEENLKALAQPELLTRALANIVRNAIRYAGKDGKISISAEDNGNNQVLISIADSGSGVPAAEIEKLFDPFYRLESDRGRQTGGTGLGLAIVKSCIEACQGKVYARNLNSKGFEVIITLKKNLS